ncbi:response regulator transcription factor [Moritella viscosa]|uniref:Phosphate regulon transcriptional regulatory protein PhoB n=1 Tax=Moritella viscosa TaxID=80854 RepID=A0A090IHY0_9GAMM|nr:response regulator transcription factor [Moritella viscosa]CED59624.1 response regulator [Moritella viscosa]SGY89078.1 DNA-binding response regulator [Moritella viscosa]SGY89080.1 DNA-binding response regulator [Moritella viscosa]SGY91218.1 DNA-binding response regulator [Moritella viscosa]SGY91635.1 DNA-binding response regulator [Moritella viscosa]
MNTHVLVVEDQQDIANLIRINLEIIGNKVTCCHNAKDAFQLLHDNEFQLILLDLNLPDMDGLDICKTIRSHDAIIPIMMLTARTEELDRVQGLEAGADDYLAKPFSVLELQARVKALLRRSNAQAANNIVPEQIKIADLIIDQATHCVYRNKELITLTSTEFSLLFFLAKSPGRVYSREQLLAEVWDYHNDCYEHTVNSHMNRLRNKIEPNPAKPTYIKTVWGVGYKLEVSDVT